jgi:hypothetical protein
MVERMKEELTQERKLQASLAEAHTNANSSSNSSIKLTKDVHINSSKSLYDLMEGGTTMSGHNSPG